MIDIKRMVSKSALIPMMMVAVGHEIVAVMQITDHTADALTVYITQQ